MLEILVYYRQPIKYIALCILVVSIILLWLMRRHLYMYIDDNRLEMQKDPIKLAIVVFYDNITKTAEEGGGKSFTAAFYDLIQVILKEAFKKMMQPVYELGKMFIDLFKSFQEVLNGIRRQIAVMRQMLTNIFRDIYNRIEVSMATIYYLFYKLRDTLRRMYATIFIMAYMVQHTINFTENNMSFFKTLLDFIGDYGGVLVSSFTFPIGVGGLMWKNTNPDFCFDPSTKVHYVKNNSRLFSIKEMSQVVLGDRLYIADDKTHHNVRAILRFRPGIVSYNKYYAPYEPKQEYMYNIAGTVVSGTHAIHYSNEAMMRVYKDHRSNALQEYHSPNGLISFITDSGIIPCCNGILFRDYLDTHSTEVHHNIRKIVDMNLNKEQISTSIIEMNTYDRIEEKPRLQCYDLYTGFVITGDQWHMRYDPVDIEGIVDIDVGELSMYEITDYSGIQFSGNTWIMYGDKWILVHRHPRASYVGKNTSVAKQYFTSSNIINLCHADGTNDVYIRDMLEIGDNEFLRKQLEQLEEYGDIQ